MKSATTLIIRYYRCNSDYQDYWFFLTKILLTVNDHEWTQFLDMAAADEVGLPSQFNVDGCLYNSKITDKIT
jgi:hypothetical protein